MNFAALAIAQRTPYATAAGKYALLMRNTLERTPSRIQHNRFTQYNNDLFNGSTKKHRLNRLRPNADNENEKANGIGFGANVHEENTSYV